jgi:16S rRNA (adenine1518-N6/adenine1519-N6)-dimethyltransferase
MTEHQDFSENARRGPSWRELLRELEVRPSKALGQNFLHDQKIVRRIVDVAEVGPESDVVEIGPGLGILTAELVQRARSVIAIELDSRLAARIRQHFGDVVRVIEGDVLEVDLNQIVPSGPYLVVANLPYSIATAAIQRLMESEHPPSRMVIMVQREVAERMTARPPQMSILAVAVQFFGQARMRFRIGAGAFIPRPRVESAVVQIDRRDHPLLPREDHPGFFRLVRAGFAQRRKRLDNSIAAALGLDKQVVAGAIIRTGIEPSRRAETLDVDDWVRMHASFRGLIVG